MIKTSSTNTNGEEKAIEMQKKTPAIERSHTLENLKISFCLPLSTNLCIYLIYFEIKIPFLRVWVRAFFSALFQW